MDVFELRQPLFDDYARYSRDFLRIADPLILKKVNEELEVVDEADNDGVVAGGTGVARA